MTATGPVRIVTRSSLLARAQTEQVGDALIAAHEGLSIEGVEVVTRGDRTGGPLSEVGGKGLFTAELEAALRGGAADLAVHSAKDLPAEMPEDLVIAAVPKRADARDALVSADGGPPADLPRGAMVGTSSPRRAVQLLALRPDVKIVPVRGNVDTRLRRVLDEGDRRLDAVILAMAGLQRSGLLEDHSGCIYPLEMDRFIPAAGQGTLVVQAAGANEQAVALASVLDDTPSRAALAGERMILHALGAQCRSCIAVHIAPHESDWLGLAMVARGDGSGAMHAVAEAATAWRTAESLLESLRSRGAAEVLRLDR